MIIINYYTILILYYLQKILLRDGTMEHVYLTKKDIDRAKEMKQITESETKELRKSLDVCFIDRKRSKRKE